MKPRNFPGRKNDRRIRAMARLSPPSKGLSHYEQAIHPYSILLARILPDSVARSVRTKKDRRDRAKFAHRG